MVGFMPAAITLALLSPEVERTRKTSTVKGRLALFFRGAL
jgi:hypothetical protein